MSKTRFMLCAAVVAASAGSACADVISDWKSAYLDTVRHVGGGPMPISRAAGMYTGAMFDAINAIDLANSGGAVGYQPLMFAGAGVAGASREAAAAKAAYEVMSNLYGASNPTLQALYDTTYNNNLAAIADGPAKTAGINLGAAVGSQMMAHRQFDGHDNFDPYVPGTNAGDWRPSIDTPPYTGIGHGPNWGQCDPWILNSADQFVPNISGAGPLSFPNMAALLASPEYAAQVNEVKSLGDRFSATRTAEQTEIAWFWANDRNGTYKPPGHLLNATDEVASQHGVTDLSERARMFAMVGVGMADAGIAAWHTKYQTDIDLWRPTDAIRETQDDGNAGTTPDPNWLPLNDFQPPFPAYISGHSTFGGVWAAAMEAFFGTDTLSFALTTDEFGENPGLGYPADMTREFTSFSEAGFEDAISRVFLGVHYRWDCEDGYTMGQLVGQWVAANAFQAVPAPGAGALLALGLIGAARRRR